MSPTAVLDWAGLGQLIAELKQRGYRTLGPTARGGAIVYDELESAADLPVGLGDEQDPGSYRLVERGDSAGFAYAVGPSSWKQAMFPERVRLWSGHRSDAGFTIEPEPHEPELVALIGVRACEIAAIGVQDHVLADGRYPDPDYVARRRSIFVVAVNCSAPAGTCFCVSMGTGPETTTGYDLALTEIPDGDSFSYVVEVGSDAGAAVFAAVPSAPATRGAIEAADAVVAATAAAMGRTLDTDDIAETLEANQEHPRWDEVAARCLSCANCTMVCPTCFCSTVEDVTDLTGDNAERWRSWDSCFSLDHSYIHGGVIRATTRSRYRQWLTHKLGTWIAQFGESGCVGCGRCITWCPVGIDITEEMAAIRSTA